jgi:hypothetical protein
MTKAAAGFPALIAVMFGVAVYVGAVPPFWILFAIGLGFLAKEVSKLLMARLTVFATWLMSFWTLTGIGLLAGLTIVLLWLGLQAEVLFPDLDEASRKEVAGAIGGAISTFLGFVAIKDLEEGKGFFGPALPFREALQRAYGKGANSVVGDSVEYHAVYSDRVPEDGPTGWGFRARLARAKILA